MKSFQLFIAFALLLTSRSHGATITAVASGNWSTNAVWSCNCQPTSSDNIIIPAGRTVTSSGPIILFLGPAIVITIGGTLILNNASLQVDGTDVVKILNGGKISGTGILGGAVYSGVTPMFIANGSSIDGPKEIYNGILPIKLIYFKGTTVNEGILLEWASAEELNFDYYEISRSNDGISFSSITTIGGKDIHGADYNYIDSSPFEGINYYKLTSVDLDGLHEEKQVVKSEWNGHRDWISIYPNPVSDGTIHALFSGGESGSFRLLDCSGAVVAESSIGNGVACNLHLPATAGPGIYFVQAEKEGRVERIKVIVQ